MLMPARNAVRILNGLLGQLVQSNRHDLKCAQTTEKLNRDKHCSTNNSLCDTYSGLRGFIQSIQTNFVTLPALS